MLNVNSANISGKIASANMSGKGLLLTITQLVANRFNTQYHIFLPEELIEEYKESGIKIGDEILVLNALMYTKSDGTMRYRVEKMAQIKKLSPSKEELYLGEENAKEKFI